MNYVASTTGGMLGSKKPNSLAGGALDSPWSEAVSPLASEATTAYLGSATTLRRVIPLIALGWLFGVVLELIRAVGFWDAIG